MLTFEYKAATTEGGTVTGVLAGRNRQDVAEQLHSLGHIPMRIDRANERSSADTRRLFARRNINQDHVADFTRDLSTLLRAGITLDQALKILDTLNTGDDFSRMLAQIRERVNSGSTLADAIEEHDKVFNRVYVNMLRAGESSGALESVLERLSEHMASTREMRSALVSALIYPAILIVVTLVSIFILLGYVVPQFAEMFDGAGETLPLSTRITIGAGDLLRAYGWVALPAAAAGILFWRRQAQQPAKLRQWHARLLNVPLAGEIILKIEVARFARTLATLLQNGVALVQALEIVRETMSNIELAAGIGQLTVSIKEGEGLATPLARHTCFPPFAIHMITVGEETGNLQNILLQVAAAYERDARTTIKRALALLEPALILILGGLIAAVIISILVAILSVNELVI